MSSESNIAPEWLKPELFEDILRKNCKEFVGIKSFKTSRPLSAGENYATIMLQVEIEIALEDNKSKTLSFMIKLPHDNDRYRQMMKRHNIFDVERGMYLDIVSDFGEMYREAGLDVKFGAECYKLDTENMHVALEDLRVRGFKNSNRLEGLDLEHTKAVLKKMAQWHAASAVRVEKKGKYPEIYTCGFFQESQKPFMDEVNKAMGGIFMKCAKRYEGVDLYYEAMEKLNKTRTEELFKIARVDLNEFNVLNHGDCWSNNIMFQYDAFGKIKETYFVDYQIPKYGTPAQDLYYFLLSSTKLDIKTKQFEFFIKCYHDELVEHLTLLQYPKKIPSLKDIHITLYKNGLWGYTTATGVMAIVLLDPSDNSTFENFLTETDAGQNFKLLMFSNNRYRKHAEIVLPWLYNRGAMEC